MKRFLNLALLVILLLLSGGVLFQRIRGADPTQFSDAFIYIVLTLNVIWILWNVQKDSAPTEQTKMGKS
jgi:hypothetical protein